MKDLDIDSLAYADDIAFLSKSQDQVNTAIKHITEFEKTSGLKLNLTKSKIVTVKRTNDASICGIEVVDKFSYLGYVFNSDGIDSSFLDGILDELILKLNTYKKLNLST